MLDTSTDPAVGFVLSLFPFRQLDPGRPAVRDDHPGALVAAVGDHHRVTAGMGSTGLRPGPAVVTVARQWSSERDDEFGVGVDGDLMIGRVLVFLLGAATS